jgi:hypothetical protein
VTPVEPVRPWHLAGIAVILVMLVGVVLLSGCAEQNKQVDPAAFSFWVIGF